MFGSLTNFEGGLFDDLRRMQREIDEMFTPCAWPAAIRSVARGAYPPINIDATPKSVDVYLFAAGIDPKTLEISLQQNLLTVAGERKVTAPEQAEQYRQERFSGSFRRVITLPEDVDPDQTAARYAEGVLHVSIQRREASQPRQIEVK
ncbi:Hsp20/alpha crystallin family protein [uncultured Thiocystis sp.]|jgi:HSP20 family protein|uniref:Hsp20/alpha crystallin family protein n=1 Tax=uncultured Thiocystis sp. TaxID=1202134 RepID=UPI0025D46890|nr:Hsp20/alpha crystallin family protein [uncultured Thiocystis sp.]